MLREEIIFFFYFSKYQLEQTQKHHIQCTCKVILPWTALLRRGEEQTCDVYPACYKFCDKMQVYYKGYNQIIVIFFVEI